MNQSSPIALMIFNRPEKTRKVLARIMETSPSKLYVIADGPRANYPDDLERVAKTRSLIEGLPKHVEVVRVYADENLGLRQRFFTGLDQVFSLEEQVLIIEDDCLPSLSFFGFATELLDRYKNTSVGVVAGSNFAPYSSRGSSYHFSSSPYIWGWGTWADIWQSFRAHDAKEVWTEGEIEAVKDTFSTRGQAKEFEAMMRNAHKLDTWDISFAVWLRQQGLLTAVPARNLVQNIGFGEGATHTIFENFDVDVAAEELEFPLRHPSLIKLDARRERMMWFKKRSRWLTFPLLHPVDFMGRVFRYLKNRKN